MAREYAYTVVDSFTTTAFEGNPCAVVSQAEGLSDAAMQAIAREMNLSETAFVTPSAVADFKVRFFTPRTEIPLAGHPTIATMFALATEGRFEVGDGGVRVTQETGAGVLPVDLRREGDGTLRVTMTQASPRFGERLGRVEVAEALGIDINDVREDLPIEVVNTAAWQAMAPVNSIEVLRRVRPNMALLDQLERAHDFFGMHVFALEALEPGHRAHSRHFSAGGGFGEDPVTGSASGAMAAYLWKHGVTREREYVVEQGHLMGRPGVVGIEIEGEGDQPVTVWVSGHAVTVARGVITLED